MTISTSILINRSRTVRSKQNGANWEERAAKKPIEFRKNQEAYSRNEGSSAGKESC